MLEEVLINSRSHTEFLPLAQILEEAAAKRGWKDGLLHVVIPHTTAGVTIQEGADPDVRRDMAVALEKAVPWEKWMAASKGALRAAVWAEMWAGSWAASRADLRGF